jgi:phage terminase large subunit-like protein
MKGSKQERAVPMATWYSGGRIFHKAGAIWRQTLEDELVGFPDAMHDDQWDMVAYAVQLLHQGLLSQMANKGRKLLVWPSPEDVAEMTNPMYDPEDYSGREFDLARQLGII